MTRHAAIFALALALACGCNGGQLAVSDDDPAPVDDDTANDDAADDDDATVPLEEVPAAQQAELTFDPPRGFHDDPLDHFFLGLDGTESRTSIVLQQLAEAGLYW